jgi:predicted RND superfamily exporter protein
MKIVFDKSCPPNFFRESIFRQTRDRLYDYIAAIQENVHKIGTAITVSDLATFFGFSALCLAIFSIISNFGVTSLL